MSSSIILKFNGREVALPSFELTVVLILLCGVCFYFGFVNLFTRMGCIFSRRNHYFQHYLEPLFLLYFRGLKWTPKFGQ